MIINWLINMPDLEIVRINDLDSFEKIRNDWEQLYRSDPNAHLYISWLWMYSLFATSTFKWVVLAAKDIVSSSFVAFYPLKYTYRSFFGIHLISSIVYAGKPIAAYSGFLCDPDNETEAVELIADYIASRLKWDIFLMDWTKDPRLGIFLNSFPETSYTVRVKKGLPQLTIALPGNYDTYLKEKVSRETRRKIRRRTRHIEREENYRINYSTAETIERDIDVICRQWYNRWQRKIETEWHRNALHKHFDHGLLRLSMIWDGDRPVAALACVLDPGKRIYNAYITSYDPDYANIAPGIVLFAESIRQAIELQYDYYDFTLGLDPYKLSFGPQAYEIKDLLIKKKRMKTVVIEKVLNGSRKVLKRLKKTFS